MRRSHDRYDPPGGPRYRGVIVACVIWMLLQGQAAGSGDPEHGKQLYRYYCAACHGVEGTGTGQNAPYLERMGRAPTNHSDMQYMNRLSDAELYRAISEGKLREGEPPFMPWWGLTLTPEHIWDLVAFIRSLAKDPGE
jgi:mono/diheme cytochrome c family protein